MLLTIVTVIFALIAVFEGGFLLLHRHRPFMTIDPEKNPASQAIITAWGIIMLAAGIVTVIAAFSNRISFIIIMVVVTCLLETLMALMISQLMNLKG